MWRGSTAALLLCLAHGMPSLASSDDPAPGNPATSTNLLWLLSSPATRDHAQSSLSTWALNVTLNGDSLVVHTHHPSQHAEHGLATFSFVQPSNLALSLSPTPFDLATFSAIVPPIQPSSASDLSSPTPSWSASLLPSSPRQLKLKGKRTPKLRASHESSWFLVAHPPSSSAPAETVLLLEISTVSSLPGDTTQATPTLVECVVQPGAVRLSLDGQQPPAQLSPDLVASAKATATAAAAAEPAATKSWKHYATYLLPWPASSSTHHPDRRSPSHSVQVLQQRKDGSYATVAQQAFDRAIPAESAHRWTLKWPSAFRIPANLPSGLAGNVVADRVRSSGERVSQALKQASPFKGSLEPTLARLRSPAPLTRIKAASLPKTMSCGRFRHVIVKPASSVSGFLHSASRGLAKQWAEADGPKQTFMAVFSVLQLVWLACTLKRWMDRLFGRKVEYRNRRTKTLGRKAAAAAAGGRSARTRRLGTWSSGKPRLPPRPAPGHPLMSFHGAGQASLGNEKRATTQGKSYLSATNELETTASGEIVLPSWTQDGPSALMVIVEEPELEKTEDEAVRNVYTHSKKRSDWDRMAGEWDDSFEDGSSAEQGWSSSNLGSGSGSSSSSDGGDKWCSRLSLQFDGGSGSLRYRERRDAATLPFYDDLVSTTPSATTPADENGGVDGEANWLRGGRNECEQGWRDTCLEEGVFHSH